MEAIHCMNSREIGYDWLNGDHIQREQKKRRVTVGWMGYVQHGWQREVARLIAWWSCTQMNGRKKGYGTQHSWQRCGATGWVHTHNMDGREKGYGWLNGSTHKTYMKEKRGTVGWDRATHNICDSHLTWRAERKGYSLLDGVTHSTWMTRGTSGLMGATIRMDDTCMDGYSGLKRGILYGKEKGWGCLKGATYTTQMIEKGYDWPNEDHKHSNRWQRKYLQLSEWGPHTQHGCKRKWIWLATWSGKHNTDCGD